MLRTTIALRLKNHFLLKCIFCSCLLGVKILIWVPSTQPITLGNPIFSKNSSLHSDFSSSVISNFMKSGQITLCNTSSVSSKIIETIDWDNPRLKSFPKLVWYEPYAKKRNVLASFNVLGINVHQIPLFI